MPILESKLDTRDEVYQQNKSDMLETLAELQELYDKAAEGGGEEAGVVRRLWVDQPGGRLLVRHAKEPIA